MFKSHKCLDCGETGDPRLMSDHCHMEPALAHPGKVELYHPGKVERYHGSNRIYRFESERTCILKGGIQVV